MVKINRALTITAIMGTMFLISMVTSIQIQSVYARGPSSIFGRANGLLPLPNILSSSPSTSDKPSEIASPNVPDNSNNKSPNAGGGNNKIPDGSITTSKLADGAVTNPKIADDAVSSSQIQDSSVTYSKTSFLTFHTIASGQDGFTDDGHSGIITVTGTDLSDIKASSIVIANVNAGSSDPNVQIAYGTCQVFNRFDHGFSLYCSQVNQVSLPESAQLDIAVLNPSS